MGQGYDETVNISEDFCSGQKKAMIDAYETKKALEVSNELLDVVNELANSGMWQCHFDENGNQSEGKFNNTLRHMLGFEGEDDFPNSTEFFDNLIVPEDRYIVKDAINSSVYKNIESEITYRIYKKDGSYIWVRANGRCLRYPNGRPRIVLGILEDITEKKREEELNLIIKGLAQDYLNVYLVNEREETVRVQKQKGAYAINDTSDGVDEFPYYEVCERYINSSVHPDDREGLAEAFKLKNVVEALKSEEEYVYTFRTITKGIRYYQFKYIRLDNEKLIIAFRNIDDMIKLREHSEMLRKVERDVLTGLYNRDSFIAYTQMLLDENPDEKYDMVCLEIESYGLLTGRYGVENCEIFAKALGDSLSNTLDENGILGRIDDDLFALFSRHLSVNQHNSYFREMNIKFGELSSIPGIKVNCGIYLDVDRTLSISTIIGNARMPIAGLRNKYEKNIAVFDDEIRRMLLHEEQIKEVAEEGIAKKQFRVYYQPKHDANSTQIKGAEALVRWVHPELGFISPGDFIPIFETNGFISKLDTYVFETVCSDLRRMLDEGQEVVPVSINVSQVDFDQLNLVDKYEEIADKYDIPHEFIHLEVTESSNARDLRRKSTAVEKFRQKGFNIELDDFGAGYSNLSTLATLPIDVMKIDMSLVRNMMDPKHKIILQIILAGARGLGIAAVAEGVETQEQLDMLKTMSEGTVNLMIQGYYFSKPLPVNEFEDYLCLHRI